MKKIKARDSVRKLCQKHNIDITKVKRQSLEDLGIFGPDP